MKIEFIYFMVLWMNAFPVKSRVSDKISPRELLLRWQLNYKKHCRVEPGTYCEVHDEPTPTNTMAPQTHAAIALGPTGNLQGSVKFYYITTGRILKRRSFTPMPMPDHVIQRVNAIGKREKQGRTFRFLNRRGEPFEWTDEVPEDDPEFQGLLEETADTAVYPDISAELPGVLLEEQEQDFQPVTDDPEPNFRDLAGDALYNAGIDTDEALRRAQLGDTPPEPAMVEANEDELVYELTFDLPDAGLGPTQGNQTMIVGEDRNDNTPITIAEDTDSPSDGQRSPTRARRSAAGNQPYDAHLNLPA